MNFFLALAFLLYPLQKPIEVIEDTESRKKLILAQERIIQLQTQLSEKEQLIAQAEAVKLLLEDKKAELNATRQQLDAKELLLQELQEKYLYISQQNYMISIHSRFSAKSIRENDIILAFFAFGRAK